jgi:D-alanyl-D-alanine carboxypeptidase
LGIKLAAWQPLLFSPGTQYHHSNIGWNLLGLIAAKAGGEPLPVLYQERIFRPLGLEHTAYDPQGPITGPHANGYTIGAAGRLTDATDLHAGKGADGGIVSNAEETATFLVRLMRGALLGHEQLMGMEEDNFWLGGEDSCVGPAYGGSGGGDAFKTNVWVSGDGSRVAVLLLNARVEGGVGDQAAATAMMRLYCAA